MNAESKKSKRPYESRLRDQQSNETRSRILEAFSEHLVESGMRDFSIEQVARRAGVSPRTVYHHFPNKDELFSAVTSWLEQRVTGEPLSDDTTFEELTDHLALAFNLFDENEALIRAHLVTELGQAMRRAGRSKRRLLVESLVRREVPYASPEGLRRVTALVHYLASSEAWRSMKDESGMTGHEAGQAVIWAIRTLLEGLRSEGGEPKDDRRG